MHQLTSKGTMIRPPDATKHEHFVVDAVREGMG